MNGETIMTPQIFISSTFYDLKYAREDLSDFVESYGFSPIRSEKGDIGYTPGMELDISCYEAMKKCDMAIVIIGGRYGSPASDEKSDDFEKYLSVTHKEFNTAVKETIPIFVFIEENVYSEYWTYKKNKEKIENGEIAITFAHVDNVNVYRFIDRIFALSKIAITSFKEINDIKLMLKKQWADMFKNFLISRRIDSPIKELNPSIEKIYASIKEMEIMIQEVGKKVIGDTTDDYKAIQKEQRIENVVNKIASSFEFVAKNFPDEKINQYFTFFIDKFIEAREKNILDNPFSDEPADIQEFYDLFLYEGVVISDIKYHFETKEGFFDDLVSYKTEVVDRLMDREYLKKMKFIK